MSKSAIAAGIGTIVFAAAKYLPNDETEDPTFWKKY